MVYLIYEQESRKVRSYINSLSLLSNDKMREIHKNMLLVIAQKFKKLLAIICETTLKIKKSLSSM